MTDAEIAATLEDLVVVMSAEWLDTRHAIILLQGTKYTLMALRKHGLPCRRIGKKVYFEKAAINKLIANG